MIRLFPYQQIGAEWLANKKHALLADEMGLGKSAQAITAANKVGAKTILVVCPAVGVANWMKEFEKFSPSFEDQLIDVYSYDSLVRNNKALMSNYDILIVDEIHYCKGIDTKRSKAILGTSGVVRRAKRTWLLSGTPAPNHAGDLWPILYTFGRTTLSHNAFILKYCQCYYGNFGLTVTGTKTEMIPELRKILEPFMLRRKKVEVLKDLPPISYQTIIVEPSELDLETSGELVGWVFPKDRRKELEEKLKLERGIVKAQLDSVAMGQRPEMLESVANSVSTLRKINGLKKIDSIAKLVTEELEAKLYEKIIIFAVHRDVIEGLRTRLTHFNPVTLYGGTSAHKKDKNVHKFQTSKKCQIFIGNVLAAGTSITLTAAHHVLFAEYDWVPGNNAQASMRAHRIGQKNPVTVRFAALEDSIDDRVARIVRRKTEELTEMLDGIKENGELQLPKPPVNDQYMFT